MLASHLLKRRLLMWVLGRAAPRAPVLAPFVRVGLLGFTATIVSGLLFTLGFVGLLAALYLWLESLGLQPALAFLAVAGMTFLLAAAIMLIVQRLMKKRVDAINSALASTPPIEIDESVIEIPRAILTGFLEGVLGDRTSDRDRAN